MRFLDIAHTLPCSPRYHPHGIPIAVLDRIQQLVTERYELEHSSKALVHSKYFQALCDLILATVHLRRTRAAPTPSSINWKQQALIEHR